MTGFVIVSYGCFDNAVRQANIIRSAGHRVVIVDNGLQADDADGAAATRSGVDIVRPTANAGFGVGANLGLGFLDPDLGADDRVFVMNDDLELGDGWDGPPLTGFADGTEQMVFFDLCRDSGYSRSLRPTLFTGLLWPLSKRISRVDRLGYLSHPAGACIAAPAKVWRRLGGFTARHFLYFEDTDLWQRAAADQGVVANTVPASVVWHLGARSTGTSPSLSGTEYGRGLSIYLEAHAGSSARLVMLPILLSTLLIGLTQRLRANPGWRRNLAAAREEALWIVGRGSLDTPYLTLGAMPVAERERYLVGLPD